jgi:hypothetical protein
MPGRFFTVPLLSRVNTSEIDRAGKSIARPDKTISHQKFLLFFQKPDRIVLMNR